ncbi:putative transcriptional regulator [Crenothrix polyspora]|uniref:Putative transcriptional regulator n=1 Tax=Crenothrix polyspora TaxID=360316 RepID=A0A1R4HBB1_9GAMM|nr:helix-turn-helix transcriptional regulator [Crenothrix polyspora]SJM93321.1 putative transcriptional regulator [Crenothrix polyspora]
MSVNEKIRLIRETKGLTQEQIAEKLGISPTAYGDIERGDNDPKLSKLQRIAEILEIPLSELIDLSDKGTLNINFNKQGKHYNVYLGSSNSELKEQLLINELQKKELAMKDREIENLTEIITLLKREPQGHRI